MKRSRYSGIQKEVLKLYRVCLRTVKTKTPETQPHWRRFVRDLFKAQQNVPKVKFTIIEFMIRKGYKMHEMYLSPQIKDITGLAEERSN